MFNFGQPVIVKINEVEYLGKVIDGGAGHCDRWINVWVYELKMTHHVRY